MRGEPIGRCASCRGAGVLPSADGPVVCASCHGEGIVALERGRTSPPSAIVKRCGCCGCVYDAETFARLPLVGLQDDAAGGFLELRNCPGVVQPCRSTLSLPAPRVAFARAS